MRMMSQHVARPSSTKKVSKDSLRPKRKRKIQRVCVCVCSAMSCSAMTDVVSSLISQCSANSRVDILTPSLGWASQIVAALKAATCFVRIILADPNGSAYESNHPDPDTARMHYWGVVKYLRVNKNVSIYKMSMPIFSSLFIVEDKVWQVSHSFGERSIDSPVVFWDGTPHLDKARNRFEFCVKKSLLVNMTKIEERMNFLEFRWKNKDVDFEPNTTIALVAEDDTVICFETRKDAFEYLGQSSDKVYMIRKRIEEEKNDILMIDIPRFADVPSTAQYQYRSRRMVSKTIPHSPLPRMSS